MGIFRKMLIISSSQEFPHLKGSLGANGIGLLGEEPRCYWEPFTLFPRKLQVAGGSRGFWEPCPLATPASKPRSHTSFPSLQQTRMQRSDFQGEDEYYLSFSAGKNAPGWHLPGALAVPDHPQFGKISGKHFSNQHQLSMDNQLDGATCWKK